MQALQQIRQQKPLIHNITNIVVANFTANGLLALGASPTMANAPEEAADMAAHADALVLNIGTCTKEQLEAMLLAGKSANQKGTPVILDPVALGATSFRSNAVNKILSEINVTAIRGNAGEISLLGEVSAEVKGADSTVSDLAPFIPAEVSRKYGATVIATGETDIVTDGPTYALCKNGVPMLQQVTGAGCLLTAVIAAFLSVEREPQQACMDAVSCYGVAAERALESSSGPGSFQQALLDELDHITAEQVIERTNTERRELVG